MSWLLDVNLILASRWTTHPDHQIAKLWLESLPEFYTCAITELGFVRVSLSTPYAASWNDTLESLEKLHSRSGWKFLLDDVKGTEAAETPAKDTTDAHLVALAKRHGLKLATLDMALIAKPWAIEVAGNPLRQLSKTT